MSLFSGSGGFELAGTLCGFEPVAASEVEPYPIAVTRSRFPRMKHLGDVSKVNGGEIDPVDVITFGSPCQDLSVAGKRAGLKHEDNGDDETTRSGLFMEAVRIIKEMRSATNGMYPTFALWENVPGAFSSNGGDDFRVVLEELIKIVEPTAKVPPIGKDGWPYSDILMGDRWSLAYRTLDAQFWGVPQRRRRIYLVLDLGGRRAGKVLFERESLRGYFEEGGTPWQRAAAYAQGSSGTADSKGSNGDVKQCSASEGYPYNMEPIAVATAQSGAEITENGICPTITAAAGMSGNNQPWICHEGAVPYTMQDREGKPGGGKGFLIQEDISTSLRTSNYQYLFQPVVAAAAGFKANQGAKAGGIGWQDETACTLNADCPGLEPTVCQKLYDVRITSDGTKVSRAHCYETEISRCLGTSEPNPDSNHGGVAVVQAYSKVYDARGNGDGETVPTLTGDHENRVTDYTAVLVDSEPIPIHDQATRFSGKRGDKSDGKGNGLGIGNDGDPMNTLTSGDRHAVCYAMQAFGKYTESDTASAMKARDFKDATDLVCECAGAVRVRYIVRRLTPTECARLQGFPDAWGHPDPKDSLTDEEYSFWLEVRNTHATINGKAVKEYTRDQMLTWYNKLHTDSAEYKMWGNGIALPTALYVMQGIADALHQQYPQTINS